MRNMKFWKSVMSLAFVLIMNTVYLSANTNFEKEPNSLTEQITNHLSNIDQTNIPDGTKVMIDFMINGKGEIIVLATSDTKLDFKIKENLNYKKLSAEDLKLNTTYSIPLVFKKQ